MKISFTQKRVEDLEPTPGKPQTDVWDSAVPGFGVRVSSNRKTFFVYGYVNRQKVRVNVGTFPAMNVEDARKKAKGYLVQMGEGINPNVAKEKRKNDAEITLGNVFKDMLQNNNEIKQSTKDFYEEKFNKHLSRWESTPVVNITEGMVQELHKKISTDSGPIAANQSCRLLRSILNYSKAEHKIPLENPVQILSDKKMWHREKPRKRVITLEDFPAWYQAVQEYPTGDHGRDYLLLILFTGLRKNEATKLEWKDVDFKNRTLTVYDTKNGEDHCIPLPSVLVNHLKARKERYGEGDRYVFQSHGKTGHLFNSQHFVNEIKKRYGLEYRLHDIRRTFTTVASNLGYNVWLVNRLTNHANQDVTGKHYVTHSVDDLREPMERIANKILQLAKPKGKIAYPDFKKKAA